MSDIFISFKYHDENGNITSDYYKAKELCTILRKENFSVFFSDDSIISLARSEYKKVLDENIESAKVLIVVSSCPKNSDSNWVRYEWDNFYMDLLNGLKNGMLLSLFSDIRQKHPLTLRNNQFFDWTDEEVNKLVQIVKNFFKTEKRTERTENQKNKLCKGSSYSYDVGDEKNRLKVQAKLESEKDKITIKQIIESIDRPTVNILDVGCSMGSLTKVVFGDYGERVNVLGVDKFQECVDGFNSLFNCDNFKAELLDFDEDWTDKLSNMMHERGIDKFDLVYCSMSLHHMADSDSVVKKLYSLIRNNGYIYVRTSDDNLKIAYPDPDGIIGEIINMTSSIPGIADRYHGRKIFRQLAKAKFTDIKVDHYSIDTAGKSQVERNAIFTNTFSWRKNYFIRHVNAVSKTDDTALIDDAVEKFVDVGAKIEKVEEYFTDPHFYFAFFVTTAIGRKIEFVEED